MRLVEASKLKRGPRRHLPLLVGAVFLFAPCAASAQSFSPFSDFLAMSDAELATLQIKLTTQSAGSMEASVLLTSPLDTRPDTTRIQLFRPYRRPEFNYDNDDFFLQGTSARAPLSFALPVVVLRDILTRIALHSGITDGGIDDDGSISFALFGEIGGVARVFDSILSDTNSRDLLSSMRAALASSPEPLVTIQRLSCSRGLTLGTPPTDITNSVQMRFRGFRLNRSTGLFVNKVTVTNTGGAPINGPIRMVIPLTSRHVKLQATEGESCVSMDAGWPYLTISAANLPPGATIEKILHFSNPDHEPIQWWTSSGGVTTGPRVFAGPGEM